MLPEAVPQRAVTGGITFVALCLFPCLIWRSEHGYSVQNAFLKVSSLEQVSSCVGDTSGLLLSPLQPVKGGQGAARVARAGVFPSSSVAQPSDRPSWWAEGSCLFCGGQRRGS